MCEAGSDVGTVHPLYQCFGVSGLDGGEVESGQWVAADGTDGRVDRPISVDGAHDRGRKIHSDLPAQVGESDWGVQHSGGVGAGQEGVPHGGGRASTGRGVALYDGSGGLGGECREIVPVMLQFRRHP